MELIDTHCHLYDNAFNPDRTEMITRAISAGVQRMLLPNVDSGTIEQLKQLCAQFPSHCLPMMGIHPCSIQHNYREELDAAERELRSGTYVAVGEIGLDFYWDKTYVAEQEDAFRIQCRWALELNLPVAIHSRNATYRIIEILKEKEFAGLRGVFHCFTGSVEEAREILKLNMYLGIGGVLTYKNANLGDTLKQISLQRMILETDAPYLPPVPHRGKRNESAYVLLVAEKLADIYGLPLEELAAATTANAKELFRLT
jgi:TatD DNase family protein